MRWSLESLAGASVAQHELGESVQARGSVATLNKISPPPWEALKYVDAAFPEDAEYWCGSSVSAGWRRIDASLASHFLHLRRLGSLFEMHPIAGGLLISFGDSVFSGNAPHPTLTHHRDALTSFVFLDFIFQKFDLLTAYLHLKIFLGGSVKVVAWRTGEEESLKTQCLPELFFRHKSLNWSQRFSFWVAWPPMYEVAFSEFNRGVRLKKRSSLVFSMEVSGYHKFISLFNTCCLLRKAVWPPQAKHPARNYLTILVREGWRMWGSGDFGLCVARCKQWWA